MPRESYFHLATGDLVTVQYFCRREDGSTEVVAEVQGSVTKVRPKTFQVQCPVLTFPVRGRRPMTIPAGVTSFSRSTGVEWACPGYGFRLHPKHARPPEESP